MTWRNKVTNSEFEKNWNREAPSFANINLLGVCNADCYFCLGKDIDPILSKQNQLTTHYNDWKNFPEFLELCDDSDINRLYITGQNTDALMYKYLEDLIDYLQNIERFHVGLRTNGFLAKKRFSTLVKCKSSVGLSIHTLNPMTNKKIMGTSHIPDWYNIIPDIPNVRISIVLNRFNDHELMTLLEFAAQFENVKYIQVRRICTDSRENYLIEDVDIFEQRYKIIAKHFKQIGEFYNAPIFKIFGKEVCFWRTVKTDIDSYNYFTDGTISDEYFVIEGYMRESKNYPKKDSIPIEVHGMGKEGFWRIPK